MGDDLTVEILKQIGDGITSVGDEVRTMGTNLGERIDRTHDRLDKLETRFGRVEQGLVDLGGFMRQIAGDQQRHEGFHSHHVDLLEKDVADLKQRMRRAEDALSRRE
ncbi:MAG: hypothetical protein EXR72_10945 [Myxococcales bacterium]|nr:hypothetical protein [Myxococcales bacterium]